MAMPHLLKIRTSIDIFKNEKCKVTFGLEYIILSIYMKPLHTDNGIDFTDRPQSIYDTTSWLL